MLAAENPAAFALLAPPLSSRNKGVLERSEKIARELQEDQLGRRFVYKNYKGEELEREYWAMIVHILNHATHHRGEISALLDRRGVANDFSGFTTYIK